jgi:hypothetical protein
MWTNALRNRASVGSHVMANYARRLHSGMRGLGLCTRGIQSAYARIEPVAEELREAALTCAWVIQKDPAHADGLLQQTTQLRGIAGLRRFMGSIALDHDAIVPSSMRAVMDRASHCAQTVSIQSGLVLFLYGVADHAWYVEMVREVAALLQVSDAGLTARQVDTYASVREAGGDLCAQWIQQRSLRALQPACEVAAHCFAQWWMPTYPLGLSASTQSIAQHHTDREQFMEHNTSVLAYVSPYAMAHNDANGGPALALVGDHGVRPLHPLRARTAHSLEEHHAMSRWCQTALSIFDVMDPHVHWKY